MDFLGAPRALPDRAVCARGERCAARCYLTFGLHHAPNRYDLYCEPFAEQHRAAAREAREAPREHGQRYASRLEHYCRLAPDNWFNFYDVLEVAT